MNKTMMMAAAMIVAAPAAAQTTTCRNVVFNAPEYGVTCGTQQQVVQPVQQPQAQLQMRDWAGEQQQANAMQMQRREMALREREIALAERQAGMTPQAAPAAPSTGRKIGRALFGF